MPLTSPAHGHFVPPEVVGTETVNVAIYPSSRACDTGGDGVK